MLRSGSRFLMGRAVPKALLAAFVAFLLVLHVASSQQDFQSRKPQKKDPPADFLSQTGWAIRETMDAWIGPDIMHVVAETLSQVLWAVSSAISVACFALSGISAQLLSAMGLDGEHLTQGLKLSPGQVQTFLLWGAGALVAYWVLALLLGLLLALLGRILWGLKLVLFLVGFVAVVRSVPDPSIRALMLLGLLTLYALLSRLSGSRASGAQLEAKVRGLERQVEELRWRQRRAAKASRGAEE